MKQGYVTSERRSLWAPSGSQEDDISIIAGTQRTSLQPDLGSAKHQGQRPAPYQPGAPPHDKDPHLNPRAHGPLHTSLGQRPRKGTIVNPRATGPAHISIPNISLVVFHPVLLQKRQIFLLKTAGSMVFILMIDIGFQCPQIRRSYRECSVPPLPREMRQRRRLTLEPLRRRGLQLPNQIRDRQRTR